MERHSPILAATALDPGCDEAIRQAEAIARAESGEWIVCHALPELYGNRPLFPQLHERDIEAFDRTRSRIEAILEAQLQRVLGDRPRPAVRLESGSPHAVVLEAAREVGARLIVVGRGSAEKGASLGGVSERIVRHAHCPVLVAAPPGGKIVLAATDFSDPAWPAIRLAHQESGRRGLRLAVVHAVETAILPYPSMHEGPTPPLGPLIEALTDDAHRQMERVTGAFGPEVQTIVREGSAAQTILRVADELDAALLVVGTHGRTGFMRVALGSVAEAVVRRSTRSVLTVRMER